MMFAAFFLTLAGATGDVRPPTPSLLAIRVGRAETIAKGTLENAVVLIENGKIVTIGEDLPVERGIPVLDRPTMLATDEGRNSLGQRVTSQYVYAARPSGSELSLLR